MCDGWERRPLDRLGEWVTIASNDTDEPTTVREALSSSDSEHWHQAMQNEMSSLYEQFIKLHELVGLTLRPRSTQ